MERRACVARCLVRTSLPALLLLAAGRAHIMAADGESLKALWPVQSPHEFQEGLRQEIGFSFTYDGKEVGPARPADWRVTSQADGTQTTFRHPSGLAVLRQARTFPAFEAVEYTLRFRNESQSVLPALAAVSALDVAFEGDVGDAARH
ncbi:MAG: hypothetical protein IMZ44_07455 [Planctomycetes bacterium]|nr:hypothetical protein [Planctomycetota bacterium]